MAGDHSYRERYGPAALVTGASSGIGEQFAVLLAEAGLDLVLAARREERLQSLAERLRSEHGVQVTVCPIDLSEPDGAEQLLAQLEEQDIGLVINNAGFGLKGMFHENPQGAVDRLLTLNCRTPLRLCHHFIPRLLARGRGGLLFTASVEGFIGYPYSAPYSASKSLQRAFCEALWGELKPLGIDVLALCPGATDTEALDGQGIDKTQLQLMPARQAAEIGLEHLGDGPWVIAGEDNQGMVESLQSMPRKEALEVMAQNMKAAIKG